MTEEQLEIDYLRKANKKLYKTIEDVRVDCYKCTCGKVSECNCFHLGLKREPTWKFETLLEGLEF